MWRITGYEDQGRCWEMPAEYVNCFQFRKDSPKLPANRVSALQAACDHFSQRLNIPLPPQIPEATQTALEFASLPDNPKEIRSSYCVKFTYPVSALFTTFFETRQLNEKHQEQEAILFYRNKLLF